MRRFSWPLQRVLDVNLQRELALRSELISLMRRITHNRQEVIRRRAVLRMLLSDIGRQSMDRRIGLQEVVMGSASWEQRRTRRLEEEIDEWTAERTEKTAELVKLRKSTQTLARTREEALQEHLRDEVRQEQKQFDEVAQVSFARRMIENTLAREAGV